jgi:hypothetical protein
VPSSTGDFDINNAFAQKEPRRVGQPVSTDRSRKPGLFSYGKMSTKSPPPRTSEESSRASTATPPKLDNLTLESDAFGGDFGDIMNGWGHSSNPDSRRNSRLSQLPSLQTDELGALARVAMAWGENQDQRPMSGLARSGQSSPLKRNSGARMTTASPGAIEDADALAVRKSFHAYRESVGMKRLANQLKDHDDRTAAQSNNGFGSRPTPPPRAATAPALFDSEDPRYADNGHIITRPKPAIRAKQQALFGSPNDEPNIELFPARKITAAPSPVQREQTKVMTGKQFERYRQERERQHVRAQSKGESAKDEGEESEEETYDDDDETERNRKAIKLRRKQEAHISSYRQSMMKSTGESQSPLPMMRGMSNDRNMSPNTTSFGAGMNPSFNMSSSELGHPSPGVEDDDDDEDVPLGVLVNQGIKPRQAVHRFSSHPNLAAARTSSAASVAAGPPPSRDSRLPPFARNLPSDIQVNRQRPNTTQSMYGGPPAPMHGPGTVPGGLVGVIASEERAKALRRSSPSNVQPARPFTAGGLVGPPGQDPSMYQEQQQMMPTEITAQQMADNMAQMQQMQMQLMQQMMAMVSMQQGGGANPAMAQAQLQSMQQMQSQMASMPQPLTGNALYQQQQLYQPQIQIDPASIRNVSPSYAGSVIGGGGGGGVPGYAASIAPTERSTVGLPSRYRPVSQAGVHNDHSYIQQHHQQQHYQDGPVIAMRGNPSPRNSPNWHHEAASPEPILGKAGSPGPVVNGVRIQIDSSGLITKARNSGSAEEGEGEDEDAVWEELSRKKEKKKAGWRMKKRMSEFIS